MTFYGGSFITDHMGSIVQKLADDSKGGILVHEFDLDAIQRARVYWGVFRDRRPDLYGAIATLDGGSGARVSGQLPPSPLKDLPEAASSSEALLPGSTPASLGYSMPAEWHPHACAWMAWPRKRDLWRLGCVPAQTAVVGVAAAIARFEPVHLLVRAEDLQAARAAVPPGADISLVVADYEDIWLRDTGPTFVLNRASGRLGSVGWAFNGWGAKDISDAALEDTVSTQITLLARAANGGVPATGFRCAGVLEGGSIHVDGEGTLLTTEECVLNANRANAHLPRRTQAGLSAMFREQLGVETCIFVPRGVHGDADTDGHVDNLCTFVRPGHVLLTFPDDPTDPQYAISQQAQQVLESAVDARGRRLVVHRIPHPTPMHSTPEDLAGLEPVAGTDALLREAGTRLAGSYINYYLANGGVVMPRFNVPTDEPARRVLQALFPDREIVAVDAREILLGGGNIHCITQQQPKLL